MTTTREDERLAFHEAGHVVVAYEFGWWVRRGGVRLWPLPRVKLQHCESDYTVHADVCIYMAGLLAEQKFHGVQRRFEEDVVEHVRAVRAGKDEVANLFPSDLRAIALALIDDDPLISCDPNGVRSVVAYYRNVTNALLDEPRVWGGAERVAKALIRRRYLSPRVVKQVLGDAFFAGLQASKREAVERETLAMETQATHLKKIPHHKRMMGAKVW